MSLIRQALQKLRGARHIEWALLAGVLAAALLLSGGQQEHSASTALERRMENVLSMIEGAGRVRVLVNQPETVPAFAEQSGKPSGVIVVAEGAGNMKVNLELQRAVQALLGVEAGQIEILSMKEEGP